MTNERGQIYQRNVRHAYIFLRRHFGSRSKRSGSFIFKMAAMLQIPRVFPLYLASEVQKKSNAPVPSQKSATKVSKSRAIPPYVPGVNPPGWPLISALYDNKQRIHIIQTWCIDIFIYTYMPFYFEHNTTLCHFKYGEDRGFRR